MGLIGTLTTFVAGAKILASEVNANFTAIRNVVNGNIDSNNLAADAVGAAAHADISSSTDTFHSGTSVKLTDAGGYFTTDTAEGALQQVGAIVGTGGSLSSATILKYVGSGYGAASSDACGVTIPANSGTTFIMLEWEALLSLTTGSTGNLYLPLEIDPGTGSYVALSSSGANEPRFCLTTGYAAAAGGSDGVHKTIRLDNTILSGLVTLDFTKEMRVRTGTRYSTGSALSSDEQFKNMNVYIY